MSIDNETREPTKPPMSIYEERAFVRPGLPADRTIIAQTHFELLTDLEVERLRRSKILYFGQFAVQHTDARTGRPVGQEILRFNVPVESLHSAFVWLDNETWVGVAVQAAMAEAHEKRRRAAVSEAVRSGPLLLNVHGFKS